MRLTPLAAADAEALRAIRADPRVAEWWDELEPDFPMDDEPESTRFTIHHEGEIAGMVQFAEEEEPKYRHASIDIFVAPEHQGRGRDRGGQARRRPPARRARPPSHHDRPRDRERGRVACYSKAGLARSGCCGSERDSDGRGWHDSLMMELVIEPE